MHRFFGETGGLGSGGGRMFPNGSRAMPWREPSSKAPRSSQYLVLWNHLPLQPVMKLTPSFFCFFCFFCFSKLLPIFEFEVNFIGFFNPWKPCVFTNYLSLCILFKIYWNKKLFWSSSLGAQTRTPASKSLWIRLC